MRVDLSQEYAKGMSNLQTWRVRYGQTKYAEKVMLNVFYRKYSMLFMWDKILNSFYTNKNGDNVVLWNDYNEGYHNMLGLYENQSLKTIPILLQLLSEQSSRRVGNIAYAEFSLKIKLKVLVKEVLQIRKKSNLRIYIII